MTKPPWDHGGKSRHERGYGRKHELMREELKRKVVLCEECTRQGRTRVGTHADHITPKARGGTDDRSNYQLLCRWCHAEKSAREQGRRRRPTIGFDGWPIEEGER